MTLNLATVLRETAAAAPDAAVCISDEGTTTFRELDELSARLAAGLRARGLVPGDSVAVQLPNSADFLVAHFGVLRAGLVVVPVNPLLMTPELDHVLADSGARLLLTDPEARPPTADVDVLRLGPPGYEALLETVGSLDVAPTEPPDTA